MDLKYLGYIYLCPICRISFDNFTSQLKLKEEIGNLQINCEKCNMIHKINESCSSNFICKICDATVSDISDKLLHHLENECGIYKNGILYSCNYCNEKLLFKSSIKMRQYHNLTCTKRPVICEYCKLNIAYDSLDEHQKMCKYTFCNICRTKYYSPIFDDHRLFCQKEYFNNKIKDKYNVRQPKIDNNKLINRKNRLKKKLNQKR